MEYKKVRAHGKPLVRREARLANSSVLAFLLGTWAILLSASIVQDILNGTGIMQTRVWMLDVDVETGLYTWFSTIILALASALIGFIALERQHERHRLRFHWFALFAIFLVLSVDEACSIHEAISARLS